MGMGGGGSSSGTLAHVHDNSAGQGGPLSELTLFDTTLLGDITPYRVLDDHIATGAESTHTFTPATALDFDDISRIVFVMDGDVTGNLEMLIRINGLSTASYMWTGIQSSSGVNTGFTAFSQTASEIMPTITANSEFRLEGTILKNQGGDDNEFGGESNVYRSANARVWQQLNWSLTTTLTTLSSVEILTSASTWKIGTRITMYGVNR